MRQRTEGEDQQQQQQSEQEARAQQEEYEHQETHHVRKRTAQGRVSSHGKPGESVLPFFFKKKNK